MPDRLVDLGEAEVDNVKDWFSDEVLPVLRGVLVLTFGMMRLCDGGLRTLPYPATPRVEVVNDDFGGDTDTLVSRVGICLVGSPMRPPWEPLDRMDEESDTQLGGKRPKGCPN